MIRFREYVAEGKHPLWVRTTVVALTLRIRKLNQQIEREKDPVEQNRLIAQQNKLLGYMSGLGIAVGSSDQTLLRRLAKSKS